MNTRQNHLTKLCFIPNRLTSLQSQLQEPRVRHHLPQKNQNADNPTGRQTKHPEDFLQRYYSPWWLHCNSACCVPAQSPPGSTLPASPERKNPPSYRGKLLRVQTYYAKLAAVYSRQHSGHSYSHRSPSRPRPEERRAGQEG